jgi:hypothetical protein
MTYFPAAPLDRSVKLVSFGAVLLLLLLMPLLAAGNDPQAVAIVFGIGAVVVLASWGMAPAGYAVSGGGSLRIRRRLFGGLDLTVQGPAERAPWTMGVGSIRLGGSGGLFGYYGSFHKPGVGRYRVYLTDRSRLVSVPTDRGLVVLSPADPDAFLQATEGARR